MSQPPNYGESEPTPPIHPSPPYSSPPAPPSAPFPAPAGRPAAGGFFVPAGTGAGLLSARRAGLPAHLRSAGLPAHLRGRLPAHLGRPGLRPGAAGLRAALPAARLP